jgi:hypothetical protein
MKCSHAPCHCSTEDEAHAVEREGEVYCCVACARQDRSSSGLAGECPCRHAGCAEVAGEEAAVA